MSPKLSIIIVSFNAKEFLRKCLESILRIKDQEVRTEVIIVDNASSDESVEEVLSNKYKVLSIKLIKNGKNLGFAKANNQGIKEAKGEYVLLLNPDTILLPKTLSFMTNFMEENPKVGVATCRVELPDGQLDDACHRGFPTPWNALCHFSGLSKIFPRSGLFNGYHLGYKDLDKVHEIDSCVGAFMLIRRKAGEEVGWLDEDYFWYGEDLDFCFRIKQKGWEVIFVPNVSIIHHKGVSSGIKKHSQKYAMATIETRKQATEARFLAMEIFYKKNYKDKYPWFITGFVMMAIEIKKRLTLTTIH